MKKILLSIAILLGVCGPVFAAEQVFEPNPANLYDLDHSYYYSWGMDWQLPSNEEIVSADLYFYDINNWVDEDDDTLYVSLLNSATPGVFFNVDDQSSGNAFSGIGTEFFTYTDLDENIAEDLVFPFNGAQLSLLTGSLADGNFGLGIDPDCHYYNEGIKLKINTRVVPEPVSGALFLLGGGALAIVRRVRRKA